MPPDSAQDQTVVVCIAKGDLLCCFPDQSVNEKEQASQVDGVSQKRKIPIGKHDQIHKEQDVSYRQAAKTGKAPKQQVTTRLLVTSKKEQRAKATRQSTESIDYFSH
jgi:hypothetical protein